MAAAHPPAPDSAASGSAAPDSTVPESTASGSTVPDPTASMPPAARRRPRRSTGYEIVVSHLAGPAGVEPAAIHSGATFEELGLDSLTLIELALVVEDETGVDLEPFLDVHTTVSAAAARLERALAARPAPAGG